MYLYSWHFVFACAFILKFSFYAYTTYKSTIVTLHYLNNVKSNDPISRHIRKSFLLLLNIFWVLFSRLFDRPTSFLSLLLPFLQYPLLTRQFSWLPFLNFLFPITFLHGHLLKITSPLHTFKSRAPSSSTQLNSSKKPTPLSATPSDSFQHRPHCTPN
jgi:hypothetical protein